MVFVGVDVAAEVSPLESLAALAPSTDGSEFLFSLEGFCSLCPLLCGFVAVGEEAFESLRVLSVIGAGSSFMTISIENCAFFLGNLTSSSESEAKSMVSGTVEFFDEPATAWP